MCDSADDRQPGPTLGERVFAQWEPGFLYPGIVEEVDAERALVAFDDGDAGWIPLPCIKPFALECGQPVMSRRPTGLLFSMGVIEEIDGQDVLIRYGEESGDWVPIAQIRIRCEPIEGAIEIVRKTSHFAFLEHLQRGDRVWGVWNRFAYFPGILREFSDQQMLVEFDDGDQAWIFPADLLPLEIIPGMSVLVRSNQAAHWLSATVSDFEGERALVRFDDQEESWTLVSRLALRIF